MKKNVRLFHLVAVVAALGLAVGTLASCGTPAPTAPATPEAVKETVVVQETVVVEVTPKPKEPIKIGMHESLSGAVAWIGQDFIHGFTLAIDEINAEGGIQGHPLQLIPCDDEALPDKAIACTRRLVDQDNVVLIADLGNSSATLASMPITQEYEVPGLVAASTNPTITDDAGVGGNIWVFRQNANDRMMAEAFAGYLGSAADTFCTLAVNNDWGRGAIAMMKPLLEAQGAEILSEDYFEQGQPDYRPVITRWKGLNPGAVYLIMEARDAAIFIRQYRELGMTQPVFARGSVVTHEFLEAIADDVTLGEGIVEATLCNTGADPELEQKYLARWGTMPHAHGAMAYTLMRYVVPQALEIALEETGELTPSSIRDGLEKVSVDTPLIGHVEFDDHNQAHPYLVLQKIENGQIVLLERLPTD